MKLILKFHWRDIVNKSRFLLYYLCCNFIIIVLNLHTQCGSVIHIYQLKYNLYLLAFISFLN